MINFHFATFVKLTLALLLALLQSPVSTTGAHMAMLNIGDEIDGMTLTSGAKDAPPIWAFCSWEESEGLTTADCWVPQMPALAIGHIFLPANHAFSRLEPSALQGELYMDNRLVNLAGLDTYSYLSPILTRSLSPTTEVLVESNAWDVVLTNLQPGEHRMEGRVRTDLDEYRWVIHLVIEAKPASYWKALPRHDEDEEIRSGCSLNDTWLSGFHSRCNLYG